MGARGPKPGTHKYQRIAARGAKAASGQRFTMGKPKYPEGMTAAAKKVWKSVVAELDSAGILAVVDAHLVVAYCNAVVEVREMTRTIDAEGVAVRVPVKDRHGVPTGEYTTQPHPMLKAKDSREMKLRQFAADLGIGATIRAKANAVTTAPDPEKPNKVLELRERIAAHRAKHADGQPQD